MKQRTDPRTRAVRPGTGARCAARTAGFTLAELMIVLAMTGVFASMAVPATDTWLASQRLRGSTRAVAQAFAYARGETVRTGNIHAVFVQQDTDGDPLIGPAGNAVEVLVIDDGRPGVSNCAVDPGEAVLGMTLEDGVAFGTADAGVPVASDSGGGAVATGSTFLDSGGAAATWVLFLPEGIPVAFSDACALGEVGTGAGAVYLTDGNQDSAVVLTPLGGRRTFSWNGLNGQWSS